MKKIVSILTSASLLISSASVVIAADKEARQPDVSVNGTIVEFEDQCAYITDEGRTLVPARGVFEAMGCSVEWNPNTYEVTVSNDEKVVLLAIGSDIMKVTKGEKAQEITLDVPAQIMNDRTMIPLRAVSEAIGSVIVWNESQYAVLISTVRKVNVEQFPNIFEIIANNAGKDDESNEKIEEVKHEINEDDKIKLSLYTESSEVKVGEEFEVYLKIEGNIETYNLIGLAVTFNYDKTKLEFVEDSGAVVGAEGKNVATVLKDENMNYETGTKNAYVCSSKVKLKEVGEHIYKAKFKLLSEDGAGISIGDKHNEVTSYETSLVIDDDSGKRLFYEGEWLSIDTLPIIIK